MAYVSAKVLSETINIDEVIEEARKTWDKRNRSRRRLEQWLVRLLPVGLVVMTAIFYGLSAPHTAALLTLITPTFGPFAPLGFELGILTLSALREAGWRSRSNTAMLLTLLILSVIINIAGAFIAVVSVATNSSLASDTLSGLLSRFDTLPASIQVVLFLIAPVGAVIPIMAKMTGEAVMKLALGKVSLEMQSDDERWLQERFMVAQSALLQAAISSGAGAKTAGNWAAAVVQQLYREDVRMVGAISQQRVRFVEEQRQPAGFLRGLSKTVQPVLSVSEKADTAGNPLSKDTGLPRLSKRDAIEWLRANEQMQSLHPRAMCKAYMMEKHGIESEAGYKTFERAKQDLGL